jgi:hypothetical protein
MVTNFIRAWREKTGKLPSKAFVPLSFELGEVHISAHRGRRFRLNVDAISA